MEELKQEFTSMSATIIADNKVLANESIGFKEMILKKVVTQHRKKVESHFLRLSELDTTYSGYLRTKGTINEILMLNAQLQILSLARSMATGSLKNYETSLTEFEGQIQFRLNLFIAVVALVVSVVGLSV